MKPISIPVESSESGDEDVLSLVLSVEEANELITHVEGQHLEVTSLEPKQDVDEPMVAAGSQNNEQVKQLTDLDLEL